MPDLQIVERVVVTLDCWEGRSPRDGALVDRWSLVYDDRAIITRESEFECRSLARECGWVVRRVSYA